MLLDNHRSKSCKLTLERNVCEVVKRLYVQQNFEGYFCMPPDLKDSLINTLSRNEVILFSMI